jgi:hypothetical protein
MTGKVGKSSLFSFKSLHASLGFVKLEKSLFEKIEATLKGRRRSSSTPHRFCQQEKDC